ncbi:hypothetical protein M1D46_14995 [Microbacterium sp. JZ70]
MPGLIDVIHDGRVTLASSQTDKVVVSGSKADMNPLPFRLDSVDQADELWAALIEYTLEVADTLGTDRPHVLRATWFQRGNVAGIRAAATGRDVSWAASEVVGWLVTNMLAVAALDALRDSEEHLFELARKARGRHTITRPGAHAPAPCAATWRCSSIGRTSPVASDPPVPARPAGRRTPGGRPDRGRAADVPRSRGTSAPLAPRHPPLASQRHANDPTTPTGAASSKSTYSPPGGGPASEPTPFTSSASRRWRKHPTRHELDE